MPQFNEINSEMVISQSMSFELKNVLMLTGMCHSEFRSKFLQVIHCVQEGRTNLVAKCSFTGNIHVVYK